MNQVATNLHKHGFLRFRRVLITMPGTKSNPPKELVVNLAIRPMVDSFAKADDIDVRYTVKELGGSVVYRGARLEDACKAVVP